MLIAQIDAGDHVVLPDTPGQSIPVLIGEEASITGVNLRAQLGQGQPGPVFEGVDLTDSIWQPHVPLVLGGPVDGNPWLLQVSVVLEANRISATGPGVLGRLLIDTTGVNAGRFELRLADTEIGLDTDLVGDPAQVRNGSVSIAEPGDANLDGRFNSSDLVTVFQSGEFEDLIAGNSTWSEGDWNRDGDFTTSDLVIALQSGGFQRFEMAPSVVEQLFADPAIEPNMDPTLQMEEGVAEQILPTAAHEAELLSDRLDDVAASLAVVVADQARQTAREDRQ